MPYRLRSIACFFSTFLVAVLLAIVFNDSAAAQSTDPDFTIVVLPDTQYYSANYPQIFISQTNWIVSHQSSLNIKLVLGVGDIVNGGGSSTQWLNADKSVKVLEGKIPYFFPIGNHDYNKNDPQNRTASATNFNKYFGPARYNNSYSGWQGSFPSGSNENFYGFTTINGKQYLILCLEFYPRTEAVNWAANVIAANPDKEVIISLHGYGYFDNTRIALCDKYNAEYYGMGADTDGEDLFYNLVRKFKNVSLVLSGHEVTGISGQGAAGHREDLGVNGNLVNQIMANYQDMTKGGNGYLRILKFRPSLNRIEVTTYSPYTGGYMTDAANQFTVPWHADGTFAGTGSLGGKVKNASTCAAVSGVKVSYANGSATSNSSGQFTLGKVAPNNYTFTAQASGYGTNAKTIQIDPTLSENWKIFLGTTSNVGNISGTVTSNGSPVNGATVSYDGASTNTTSDGKYSLTNVPSGSLQLTAAAPNLDSASATVSVTAGVTVIQDFQLSGTASLSGASLTGKVTDVATGSALAGATVSTGSLTSTTAADGSYTLSNVPAGTLQLSASDAGYTSSSVTITLADGQTATQDFQLTATPVTTTAGTITGQVTRASDGTPIPGAQVSYNNSTGTATADANGNYLLSGFPPGTYTLSALASGFLTATASVSVTSGTSTTQSFTLNPAASTGTIAGQVMDANGSAISGATVTSGTLTVQSDSTGTYSLTGVPVGTGVQVSASASGYDPITQTADVTDGQTSQLNFTLQATAQQPVPEPTTGAVSGKLTNLSTGGALSGATVKYSGGSTTTDTSGLYSFSTVAPGTYTFTASKSGYLSRSTSVTVSSGTTTTADIALSTAGKISGTVKNGSGVAIGGATVTITGGNIATTLSTTTSSTGAYGTAYIPIGSYKVTVSKSGYTTQTKSTTVYSGKTATVSFTLK